MDYSPYYFKNFYSSKAKIKNKKKTAEVRYGGAYYTAGAGSAEDCPPAGSQTVFNTAGQQTDNAAESSPCPLPKKKRLKDKAGFFTVLIIVLCFASVIFATEFFSGGMIVKELKSAFSADKSVKYYFVVTGGYDNEYSAVNMADLVKEKGGAGFVYVRDGVYYVVVAPYLDKKSAESVRKKNDKMKVFELTAKRQEFSGISENQNKLCEKVWEKVLSYIEELYSYSAGLDSGEMKASDVLDKISSIRNDLLYLKNEVSDSALKVSYKNYLTGIIDPMFGGLDAVLSESFGDGLAAAVRNITSSSVYALCYLKLF